MNQDDDKRHGNSDQESKEALQDAPSQAEEDVPSAEKEIDPGVNQDKHVGDSFSSEPSTETAGEDRDE